MSFRILSVILTALLSLPSGLSAQTGITYVHDSSVQGQFEVAESMNALADLNPAIYYQTFHKNYRSWAVSRIHNKFMLRGEMYQVSQKEDGHSERMDTVLNYRKDEEAKNLIDRQPSVIDPAWLTEQAKVERKLTLYKDNIERIVFEGGTPDDRRWWLDRYNCIIQGIDAIRDAYMPNGERKKAYLDLYNDIVSQNHELTAYLLKLRILKSAKDIESADGSVNRASTAYYARVAKGRWLVSLASAAGLGRGKLKD